MTSLPLLALSTLAVLALGYLLYGRFVARRLGPDPRAVTPAHARADGQDFVPTRRGYLLGQHFSAIAAAGPIAGPILACGTYGWLPCVLWIGLGVVFIGAVHDFTALFASVRHGAQSVAEIARQHIGARAATLLLGFIWLALLYVILAFTDITAASFTGRTEELAGAFPFNPGGAVAAASTLYLLLSIAMGLVQRFLRPPLWLLTLVFVPATLCAVWAGTQVSTWLLLPARAWGEVILGYCAVASLLPVWLLLQPRGYLGGFVLYLSLAIGTYGVLFGGHAIQQPALAGGPLFGLDGAPLFPFLFVTIACGACSGFHGLVCSGTTSKQVDRETDCRPIGYGAMLLEGFVALIALSTALIVAKSGAAPGVVYGQGIGRFLAQIIGEEHLRFATTFGLMAFSTFVFDTLDVSVRLGRYVLCELFSLRGRAAALLATLATVALPAAMLWVAEPGAYRAFWTLFGTSNQLLAALTLLAVTVWLKRTGRPYAFTLWPALFVGAVTLVSLFLQSRQALASARRPDGSLAALALANGAVAVALTLLALAVAWETRRAWRAPRSQ